jgi:membrane protein implicated in regulation of membrane protease activity
VPIWFWGWSAAAVALAVLAALTRDRMTAPWAIGAAVAAGASAIGAGPAWHWLAFLAVSSIVFVALNRRRYAPRHGRGAVARASEPGAGRVAMREDRGKRRGRSDAGASP